MNLQVSWFPFVPDRLTKKIIAHCFRNIPGWAILNSVLKEKGLYKMRQFEKDNGSAPARENSIPGMIVILGSNWAQVTIELNMPERSGFRPCSLMSGLCGFSSQYYIETNGGVIGSNVVILL